MSDDSSSSVGSDLGSRLRDVRVEKGLSLSELSRRASVSKAYLSKLEKGHRARPSLDVVTRLAGALGTTTEELVGELQGRPTSPPPSAGIAHESDENPSRWSDPAFDLRLRRELRRLVEDEVDRRFTTVIAEMDERLRAQESRVAWEAIAVRMKEKAGHWNIPALVDGPPASPDDRDEVDRSFLKTVGIGGGRINEKDAYESPRNHVLRTDRRNFVELDHDPTVTAEPRQP